MSLLLLAAAHGWQLSALAIAAHCDPLLLERVDQRRQPLPLDVTSSLAAVLGLQQADICSAVYAATSITGADASHPVPLQLGDSFTLALYAPTLEVIPP